MEFISKIRSWNVKLIFTFFITFLFIESKAQSNGINFQGVARNSSGVILASQKIGLRFSVIANSENGTIEYVESRIVNTNPQGIFSVVIGDTGTINTIGTFTNINWKTVPKFLKVEMDPAGGTSFINMGVTQLQKVPYAYYANGVNAANIDGILPLSSGGTGVSSITALKSTLGIDLLNNTSDLNKPISLATQSALDAKANSSDLQSKANVSDLASKAPIASPTFTGTVGGITPTMVGLANVDNTSDLNKPISTATQSALDLKANIADLSNKANSSELALKAPLESPTFTGTVGGITKTMVGLSNVDNTSDLLKPLSTATINALSSKASTTEVNSALLLKENISNKSTSISLGTSDELYPTQKAVKSYVDAQISAGGVADNGITTVKIADGAITSIKLQDGSITNQKISDNSINSSKINDGSIVNVDINNSASISYSKLNLIGSITGSDISNSAAIPFSKLNITQSDINTLGIPSNADLTTYTAGSGLNLNGTTFSINSSVLTSTYSGPVTLNSSSFNVDNNTIYVDGTNHKLGIGTNLPTSKLEVNGSATNSTAYNANSGTTIDFALSNLAYTSASAGAFTLNNIKDGGTYTLAVQGLNSGTSSFTCTGFTFYSTNNGATTSNKQTLYTFIVMGSKVYYFMTSGF